MDEKTNEEIAGKTCPFIQGPCRADCQLLCESNETMIRKCALAVIAQQIDILAKEDGRRF